MKFQKVLLLVSLAVRDSLAIPVKESPRQRLLDGLKLPSNYHKTNSAPPYTPDHKDRFDKAVDAVGDELDPLVS